MRGDTGDVHGSGGGDAPELFVVIAMVALHLDHLDEKRRRKRAENEKDDL
jgi:hypothetical protein